MHSWTGLVVRSWELASLYYVLHFHGQTILVRWLPSYFLTVLKT